MSRGSVAATGQLSWVSSTSRRYRSGAGLGGAGAGQGGGDQAAEQRVRPGGAGEELGVRLGGDEEGVEVSRELDELHQAAVGRKPGEDDPVVFHHLAVGVVTS